MNLCLDTDTLGFVYKGSNPTNTFPIGSAPRLVALRSTLSSPPSVAYQRWRKITQLPPHPTTTGLTTFLHPPTLTRPSTVREPSGGTCLDAFLSPQRMEVQIPSPSVFLQRSPVAESAPAPVVKKSTKPRPAGSTHSKKPSNAAAATAQAGSITKPKQSKSRNGCLTCKKKRLKCDETKPGCQQCQRRGVPCEGYRKDYKWRTFEETTFTTKSAGRSKKVPEPPPGSEAPDPRPIKASNSSGISPSAASEELGTKPDPLSHDGSPQPISTLAAIQGISGDMRMDVSPGGGLTMGQAQPLPQLSPNPTFPFMFDTPSPSSVNLFMQNQFEDSLKEGDSSVQSIFDDGMSRESMSTFSSGSPSLRDLCLPGTDLSRPPDASEPRPPPSPIPYQPGSFDAQMDAQMALDEVFDEEIVRQEMPTFDDIPNSWSLRMPSPSPSDSSSSNASEVTIYAQPSLHPASPEMLALRFDSQTCGILSVKDGPTENPWRTYVWPLARNSPALYHALSSMAAFHASNESREMRVSGVSHMHKSIKQLSSEISNMNLDAALATALALAFSESWDEHVSTGIQHLKGAKVLVNQAVVKHRDYTNKGQMNEEGAQRMKFLCNTFIYMDVIARLTSVEEDNEFNFEDILATVNPIGSPGQLAEVDPLLGCAATLFPLIGRVANLIQKVRKTEVNSIPIVSQAMELKQMIESWQPPDRSFFEQPEDPSSEVDHCFQTAEAYKWAILLYLHQAVPEIPSINSRAISRQVLVNIACVPVSSRATIVQIFPLLAASCEVESAEERAWVTDRWFNMINRLRIGNVDKCLVVVQEVWRRRDAYEAEKLNRMQRRQASRAGPQPPVHLSNKTEKKARRADLLDLDEGSIFGANGEMLDHVAQARPAKRRFTMEAMGQMSTPLPSPGMPMPMSIPQLRRSNSEMLPIPENMELEYTVRGRLHWIGVMRDWNWESKSALHSSKLAAFGLLLTSHSTQFFLDDCFFEDLDFDDSAISIVFGSVHRNSGDFSRLLYGLARYACILSVYAAMSFAFGDEDAELAVLIALSFIPCYWGFALTFATT